MKTFKAHEFAFQLAASTQLFGTVTVDSAAGIIRGVTVAKAGVAAQGHFLMLNKAGEVTYDASKMASEVPILTDADTLATLMAAAKAGGGRFKSRSDHDDTLAARAGYADNFAIIGDRVTCDLHLNDAYKDRATVLETASKTPDLIGLSIDMLPSFVVKDGHALMRIEQLTAVDIVDQGAITPAGLFLNRRVDKIDNIKADTAPKIIMDNEIAAQFTEVTKTLGTLTASLVELSKGQLALSAKLAEKPAPKKKDDADGEGCEDDEMSKLKKSLAALTEKANVQTAELALIKAERAALGMKAGSGTAGSADSTAGKAGAEEKTVPKTYNELVAVERNTNKLGAVLAHQKVMRAHPDLYAASLRARGIAK